MRLATAFLIGVIAVCAVIGGYGWLAAAPDRAQAARPPPTGMEMLSAFRCFKPTRKVVVVRGVEDNFAQKGDEPLDVRPGRRNPALLSMVRGGRYDLLEEDHSFADSIAVPEGMVSRGMFVIGLRPLRGAGNDHIAIGELSSSLLPNDPTPRFHTSLPELQAQPGWRSSGELHFVNFKDLMLDPSAPGRATMLQALEAGQKWLDVFLNDDTAVDFMGAAFCVGPPNTEGLTFIPSKSVKIPGLARLGCTAVREDRYVCNPYRGDTACDVALPVACIHPDQSPLPTRFRAETDASDWTGGRLAAAPPAPASRFRTVADVNRYCEANLGKGWRVLNQQDSMFTSAVTGFGRSADFEPRAWIDINDSPHATCWKHN
jgi:hypothetical protein